MNIERFDHLKTKLRSRWHKINSESREEYYLRVTKSGNTEGYVGPEGIFQKMREKQFSILSEDGLEPVDTLVDIGCGVLRAGIPIIKHLDRGNYYRLDISQKALLDANRRIYENGLGEKEPTLICNDGLDLTEVSHVEADWVLAQSVWTHLPPHEVKECIHAIENIMTGKPIVTINEIESDSPRETRREKLDYGYSVDWVQSQTEMNVERMDVDRPNDQTSLRLEVT